MKFQALFTAVLALAGAASANALVVADLGAYTVSYDETTRGFGYMAYSFTSGGGSTGFAWNVGPSVLVASGAAAASASFAMPDFTISVNPGWALSGPVSALLGNLVFNEFMGATTTVAATGSVAVDGGAAVPVGGALTRVVTSPPGSLTSGYYVGNTTLPIGGFSSFSFSGGSLTLTAAGGVFSSVVSQPQNELKFSLVANPVPEPETAALMLAGLLTLGSLARRRSRG